MSIQTLKEHQAESDYESRYEAHYHYAKQEWLDRIEPIKQKFEHLITDDSISETSIGSIVMIADGYRQLLESCHFEYDIGSEVIEYYFYDELKEILKNDYNWRG